MNYFNYSTTGVNTMKTLSKKMTFIKIIGFLMMGLFTSQIWALDLDSAKDAGLIGEQANGYLGLVTKPAAKEVQDLIDDINSKRKQKYLEIAKEQGVDLAIVEKRAGEKVIEKTTAGRYINAGSSWQKK